MDQSKAILVFYRSRTTNRLKVSIARTLKPSRKIIEIFKVIAVRNCYSEALLFLLKIK